MADYDVDVAIIGAGTAGMAAYREARKYTDRLALFDGGTLGTTCARVGCMPSKLLIAAADAAQHARHTEQFGVRTQPPEIDGKSVMQRVQAERDRFVGFVLEAVEDFDSRHLIREHVKFVDDHTLETSSGRRVTARAIVIGAGSRPNIPPPFQAAGDRLIVNDDVFDWTDLPGSVAVFGAGVIGLELGQALHRLGVQTRLFGRDNLVGPLSDPEVRDYAAKTFASEFPAHWHADTSISRDGDEVVVSWTDEAGSGEARFDYLLAATGRRANVDQLGLENTSLERDARGVPVYDPLSMRAGDSHVFIAGDAVVDLPLLHEAADEGRLAGENAARLPDAYRRARRTGLGVVFTDPQIGMAGESFRALTDAGVAFQTGEVSFEDQGRARVMGINKGLLRVYGEEGTGRFLGAEMIGPAAEHLTHLLAWSIESKATVDELLQRPFYHPVIEEGLRSALRDLSHALGFGPNPPLRCIDCGPGA
ncbi:MAG: dihydrolipoyl dehydrogenase [Pseudomonadota bacterium]